MSMIGNYRRITEKELAWLQANPSEIADFLDPDAAPPADRQLDIDKAWQAIHFLLCGAAWEGTPPLGNAVTGGRPIADVDVGYGPARYLTAEEVVETFEALDDISAPELLQRFDPEAMNEAGVYPSGWGQYNTTAEDQEYIAGNYAALVEFFREAAVHGDAMLIYLR